MFVNVKILLREMVAFFFCIYFFTLMKNKIMEITELENSSLPVWMGFNDRYRKNLHETTWATEVHFLSAQGSINLSVEEQPHITNRFIILTIISLFM